MNRHNIPSVLLLLYAAITLTPHFEYFAAETAVRKRKRRQAINSDFTILCTQRVRYKLYNDPMIAKYETFDDYVNTFLPKIIKATSIWNGNNSASLGKVLTNFFQVDKAAPTLISSGVYTAHIKRWWNSFDETSLKIIDGGRFLDNPGSIMEDIQEFLGLPKIVLKEDFVPRPDTGFYCYRRLSAAQYANHTENDYKLADLKCLDKHKGRTAKGVKEASQIAIEKLQTFYRPFNLAFYKEMNKDYGWI